MQKIKAWIETLGYKKFELEMLLADASYRKYYRLILEDKKTYIAMDSSIDIESIYPFIDVSVRLLKTDVQIPRVYKQNLEQGYLLLEDLGNVHLNDILSEMSCHLLYTKAIYEILKMQKADIAGLETYDGSFLRFEMELMEEWYLEKYADVYLNSEEKKSLSSLLSLITEEVLTQPQGSFVHRDYHSRNIMFAGKGKVWVIDYQDARVGSIMYDLASLLNDVYIKFDRKIVIELILEFKLLKSIKDVSDEQFIRWFDFMAMQRHIKILGIFARLKIRDNKPVYINDIPMTLSYIRENIARYSEFKPLEKILNKVQIESMADSNTIRGIKV
jgi:aminoglycoside/choline kinase family phosphotransferase